MVILYNKELSYPSAPVIILQVKVRLFFGYFASEYELYCKHFDKLYKNEMFNATDIKC